MKSEIRQLMIDEKLDALLITGAGQHNPAMVYLTGGGHLTNADLVFPASGETVLYCQPMERDEAAKSGFDTKLITEFPYREYLKQADNDSAAALAMRYKEMLKRSAVEHGRVMVYGRGDVGNSFSIFTALQKILPEVEFVGSIQTDVLQKAMMNKSSEEIERIRKMGEITVEVVGRVAEFLTHQQVENETLVDTDGNPIRIKQVKSLINLWLAELGAENPEGTIFAIGRDAGVPHSVGNPEDLMMLGKPIVFDIFPCESGGGYFHDFTRTWSLGYATDEVLKVYGDVKSVYEKVTHNLIVNTPFKDYQQMTCDLYEEMGHVTTRKDSQALEGYIHSLGHGVGLNIHEFPFSGDTAGDSEILSPGTVFTIEPGLYYPSKNLGVRLEDTYVTQQDGSFKTLVNYPLDLVLKMK